jgi:hypothetical protein
MDRLEAKERTDIQVPPAERDSPDRWEIQDQQGSPEIPDKTAAPER